MIHIVYDLQEAASRMTTKELLNRRKKYHGYNVRGLSSSLNSMCLAVINMELHDRS